METGRQACGPVSEVEVNLTRFCRLAFGATYRFPSSFDVGLSGTPKADAKLIKGVSYTISLKFGKF